MTGSACTLSEMLAGLRSSPAKVVFPGKQVLPHRELPGRASGVASLLRAAQVRPGEVVGLMMPASPEWLATFFGIIQAGAAATVLPVPPLMTDPASVARKLHPIVETARLRHVAASGVALRVARELAALSPGLVVVDVSATGPADDDAGSSCASPDPSALAIVQFSSGSTSRPKGVMLTHEAVIAGLRGINSHIATRPSDVLVQWVPLFHDMGLISLLSSLYTPNDAHLFGPLDFMRNPKAILAYITEVGGTIVNGPNFSYEKLTEVAQRLYQESGSTPNDDLARWRLALNGAEMVRAQTVRDFQLAFGPMGVPDSAMSPCYGMAEATLAITLSPLGSVPWSVTVDRDAMVLGKPVRRVDPGAAEGITLTSVGVPVPGISVRIADLAGQPLTDGFLGEILIQGPAVTTGYLHDEPATRSAIRDGWLRTGDLGFLESGELFIAGRLKEMIVVNGRNFFPDDIEEAVRHVPGIFRQHCLAVADPAEERIIIAVETSIASAMESAPARDLVSAIRSKVSSSAGLSAIEVILLPPRSLPRTTSGKWRRSLVTKLLAEQSQNRELLSLSE